MSQGDPLKSFRAQEQHDESSVLALRPMGEVQICIYYTHFSQVTTGF